MSQYHEAALRVLKSYRHMTVPCRICLPQMESALAPQVEVFKPHVSFRWYPVVAHLSSLAVTPRYACPTKAQKHWQQYLKPARQEADFPLHRTSCR